MNAIRLPKFKRGDPFEIEVDGQTVTAYQGETIATVLLAAGIRLFQHNLSGRDPSRLYCGMGVCLQCLVTINGLPSCQACRTLAQPGMKVETNP